MRSFAKGISVELPLDLNEEISFIAKREKKSISEVFREAIRYYTATRLVSEIRAQIKRTNKKIKRSDEIENLVDENRK